jgi:hypothetical protein
MKTLLRRIPWFYILFTIYPLLFLWTTNVSEIYASAVIRPLLFTLVGSGVLYAILYARFRDIGKAALVGTLILLAFFSYGHVYYEARAVPALQGLSHHSTLIPLYVVLFGFGIWWVSFRAKNLKNLNKPLNIVSLLLIGVSILQLVFFYVKTFDTTHQLVSFESNLKVPANRNDLPDVYYIILDKYMRADALQQDLGFDNRPFIDELNKLGFYVARCSRSNYPTTRASMASALNMEYISNMPGVSAVEENSLFAIIKNNVVRRQLEGIGYKTVAFRTDYPWLNFEDADVFLGLNHSTINFQELYPFEAMYNNTTAAIVWDAAVIKLKIGQYFKKNSSDQETGATNLSGSGLFNQIKMQNHVNTQLFTLDKLPEVPAIVGPKFVYVHLMIPHGPYVFGPNGEILTDPGFYGGAWGAAVNAEYRRRGYIYGVQFINKRILPILQTIINKSKKPPIIVLQGDHGLEDNNRYTNLNAYYLPNGYKDLYEFITPVNSFRLIFDEYFGADYPLLQDVTYTSDIILEDETYSDCIP